MRRSEFFLILGFLGASAPATTAMAQAPGGITPDPACACYAPPDSSEQPGEEGGDKPGKTMLLAGAAGLAVLSGVPFGGTTIQGLPFAAGPLPEPAQLAEAPEVVMPDPIATPAATPIAPPAAPPALVEIPAEADGGIVPPQTATHLPLLAAVGLMMVGSGGILARRSAQERRRKRRFVAM